MGVRFLDHPVNVVSVVWTWASLSYSLLQCSNAAICT